MSTCHRFKVGLANNRLYPKISSITEGKLGLTRIHNNRHLPILLVNAYKANVPKSIHMCANSLTHVASNSARFCPFWVAFTPTSKLLCRDDASETGVRRCSNFALLHTASPNFFSPFLDAQCCCCYSRNRNRF